MIRDFISKHILKKVATAGSLVIYDPQQFFSELVPSLAVGAHVVDVRDSILEAREQAYLYFNHELSKPGKKGLIIYSPFEAPLDEQSKIEDPFYIFTLGNSYFPNGASDRYETLCKICFPLKEQEINELFTHGLPDFDTIDALGEGNTYAKLQVLTGGKSEKEILQVLMVPSEKQHLKIKKDKTWLAEYKKLMNVLGVKPSAKTFDQVQDELWRTMLFSEFVFDLPVALPKNLQSVAVVKDISKALVLDLVKGIRNNKTAEHIYIEKAQEIENQLSLSSEFKNETRLGSIVTFAFEDNTYLNHVISLITQNKFTEAEEISKQNKENIWPQHEEERSNLWMLTAYSLKICQLASHSDKYPKTAPELVQFYASKLYEIDLLYRKFETLLSQILNTDKSVDSLTTHVRQLYRANCDSIQKAFLDTVKQWPLEGVERNISLFNKYISHELKGKKKIAYILVDAMRYEIAKDLESALSNYFVVKISPSCAFVPTVTKYAMAALVPNAEKALTLDIHEGKLESFLEGNLASNLEARRNYFRSKLGDRCDIVSLDDVLGNYTGTPDLLVVTSKEIDGAGENLNVTSALSAIEQSLRSLIKALTILKKLGYEKIVIATDHGFMIYPNFQPGDNVKRPQGDWVLKKNRCMAGAGIHAEECMVYTPQEIGISSAASQFHFLRNYAVFEKNVQYFHEGISLQEAIVPVIEISTKASKTRKSDIEIALTYRGKSEGQVTTRRPIIELMCFQEGNIGLESISIKIEALAEGKQIGEPHGAEEVNSLTKLVEVFAQRAHKIPLALNEEFEGKFEVTATDPISGKVFATLELETNYLE